MPVVADVGRFYRLGVAVRGVGDGPATWFVDELGAEVAGTNPEPGDSHRTTMLHLGPTAVALFAAADDDTTGTIGRYLDRFGAGLHSLAWRVDDLQGAEDALLARGVTITGVNREARHFFLHPKETFGILIELTDQGAGQPRRNTLGTGLVREMAWMTAVVRDLSVAADSLAELFGAETVTGLPAGSPTVERTLDLGIGDVVLRLVEPISAESRYSLFAAEVGERLHSVALRVDDLDAVPFPLVERLDERAWSNPSDTLGLRLEWVRTP
ncbi:MAG: VOC family protein [Acidimicrobiia bacterium]